MVRLGEMGPGAVVRPGEVGPGKVVRPGEVRPGEVRPGVERPGMERRIRVCRGSKYLGYRYYHGAGGYLLS